MLWVCVPTPGSTRAQLCPAWAGWVVLPGLKELPGGVSSPAECSAPPARQLPHICPNSLTFPSVFYHIRAVEAPPLLRAAFISPESSSGLAAELCCRLPLHPTIPMSWCLVPVGWALPQCMVPAARAAGGSRELRSSPGGVRVPGPAGISSVKICAFQWPLGHCGSWLAGVGVLPCPRGEAGAWEGAIVMFLAEL